MSDPERLEQVRHIARRPYSFVAFCSFCLAGVCGLISLVMAWGLSAATGTELAVFFGFGGLMLIALTQGFAALREKRLARLVMELLRHIEQSSLTPVDETDADPRRLDKGSS